MGYFLRIRHADPARGGKRDPTVMSFIYGLPKQVCRNPPCRALKRSEEPALLLLYSAVPTALRTVGRADDSQSQMDFSKATRQPNGVSLGFSLSIFSFFLGAPNVWEFFYLSYTRPTSGGPTSHATSQAPTCRTPVVIRCAVALVTFVRPGTARRL